MAGRCRSSRRRGPDDRGLRARHGLQRRRRLRRPRVRPRRAGRRGAGGAGRRPGRGHRRAAWRRRPPARASPGRNTASAAANALLAALGTRQGVSLVRAQGAAAGQRRRQQRRQRGGRRGRRERAARPARPGSTCCCAARWPASRPAAAPCTPTTSPRRSTAASCWRAAPIRPTSCACRCPPGWRARCSIRPSRSTPAPPAPCWATPCRWRRRCGSGPTSGRWSSALYSGDLALLSRSLVDHVAEPKRAGLVPGFHAIKAAALAAGRARLQPVGLGPVDLRAGRVARRRHRGRAGDGRRPGRPPRRAWPPISGCRRSGRTAPGSSPARRGADVRQHARAGAAGPAGRRRCGSGWRPTAGSTCRTAIPVLTRRRMVGRCAADPARGGHRAHRAAGRRHLRSRPARAADGLGAVVPDAARADRAAGVVGARAVPRPDAGLQGRRRAQHGPLARGDRGRAATTGDADGAGRHVGRHRRRGRARLPPRGRHPRRRALSARPRQPGAGGAVRHAGRQRHRGGRRRHLRRLPAAGQGGVLGSRRCRPGTGSPRPTRSASAGCCRRWPTTRGPCCSCRPMRRRRSSSCRAAISATSPPGCWRRGAACRSRASSPPPRSTIRCRAILASGRFEPARRGADARQRDGRRPPEQLRAAGVAVRRRRRGDAPRGRRAVGDRRPDPQPRCARWPAHGYLADPHTAVGWVGAQAAAAFAAAGRPARGAGHRPSGQVRRGRGARCSAARSNCRRRWPNGWPTRRGRSRRRPELAAIVDVLDALA